MSLKNLEYSRYAKQISNQSIKQYFFQKLSQCLFSIKSRKLLKGRKNMQYIYHIELLLR